MKFFKLVFISALLQYLKADLPVHCIAKDIEGTWVFFIDPKTDQQQMSCGHNIPDQNTGKITFLIFLLNIKPRILIPIIK